MSDASKNTPPWETWRLTHGPEDNRQTRWFVAAPLQIDDGPVWSITEPCTGCFLAATKSPANGVAHLAVNSNMVDPVIEKMDPGSPDDLRAEINYLRSREAHFASVLKVADGGQYRNDWTAPLQRVLDENKALRAIAEERARQRDEARADLDRVRLGYARGEGHEELAREIATLRAQQEPLVACVDALRAAAVGAGWRDALATGEHLVAWVRRGALREALATREGIRGSHRQISCGTPGCEGGNVSARTRGGEV